jgi:glycosyltransferase involved in cell wall biosynthesis
MRFSLVTSYYAGSELRIKQLNRAVRSVLGNTFTDFEYIIYDDGSPNKVDLPNDGRMVRLEGPHLERIIAINRGLEKAQGDWIWLIDADDEIFSYSLECLVKMIEKYPDYKVFNFSSLHVFTDYGTTIRGPFEPEPQDVGHAVFGGGNVVSGTYIFKRECFQALGGFPEIWNPWDFSKMAQEEFPEIEQYFLIDKENEPQKVIRELGNPWGQDYYMFYKLTRKYHSKPFNIPLYMVHHEKQERYVR